MKNSIIFLLVIIGICTSCQEKKSASPVAPAKENTNSSYSFEQTHEANGYSFSIKAKNGERTVVLVESKGLESEFQQSFSIEGQVKATYMLDINNDGSKEFYIATKATGDSGNIDLKAFTAKGNKSISEATVMDDKLGMREMNSDQILEDSGALIRRFKVDGKDFSFSYMLMQSGTNDLVIPTMVQ